MRAAASRVSERAFRRQSQRVTRRSAPSATFFHPVPSHSGQTSTETFMDPTPSPFRLCTAKQFRASTNPCPAVYILWRSVGGCGGRRKTRRQSSVVGRQENFHVEDAEKSCGTPELTATRRTLTAKC